MLRAAAWPNHCLPSSQQAPGKATWVTGILEAQGGLWKANVIALSFDMIIKNLFFFLHKNGSVIQLHNEFNENPL